MSEEDVDQFLWEVEAALSHVDGDERLTLVREAERLLHNEAAEIAGHEGAEDITWYHYVQASAALGPPERLAAELTGGPLPDRARVHKRLWLVAGGLVAITAVLLVSAFLTQGELSPVGDWRGTETGAGDTRVLHFNVTAEADRVFLSLVIVPNQSEGRAHVTVLDGGANAVYEDTATLEDHLEAARFVRGEAGHWRVFLTFEDFTGSWRIRAHEEL